MLPTRRDSGRPSCASPPRMPLPKLSPSSVGHRSGSPNIRGCILTNPSIPALSNGSDRGCRFSLAPVEGPRPPITREMFGWRTQQCRGNGTTPTAVVATCMSSMAWTPGRLQRQPRPRVNPGRSLPLPQAGPAGGGTSSARLGVNAPAPSLPEGYMPPSHPASSRDARLP